MVASTIQSSINFFKPSVAQVIGSNGPYGGGTQVTFYGQHLSHTTFKALFPSGSEASANVGDSGRLDISDEMVVLTMPSLKSYALSEVPLLGGLVSIQVIYPSSRGVEFVSTHPFTYGDLGQPAVVAPTTLELGAESLVLVSLPGVDAIQTIDFTGNGNLEPNVLIKTVAAQDGQTDLKPANSVVSLGDGLFQMSFNSPAALPSLAQLEVVPEGQPLDAQGVQLTETIILPLSYIQPEDPFNFGYPLGCRDVCAALDDVEKTADCGGDSQFQTCMTACQNDYFGQASLYPDTSVTQCWEKMDVYLDCVMNDASIANQFTCGRQPFEQGLGANFPDQLVTLIGAAPKAGSSCVSLLTDWETLGCKTDYRPLRRIDMTASLNAWMSMNLTCDSAKSEYQINSSQTALEFYDVGFDRTYINNGVLTTVDPSVINSCESLYDDVFTCLTNASNPSGVANCGAGQTIYFDPGAPSDPNDPQSTETFECSDEIAIAFELGTDRTEDRNAIQVCWG